MGCHTSQLPPMPHDYAQAESIPAPPPVVEMRQLLKQGKSPTPPVKSETLLSRLLSAILRLAGPVRWLGGLITGLFARSKTSFAVPQLQPISFNDAMNLRQNERNTGDEDVDSVRPREFIASYNKYLNQSKIPNFPLNFKRDGSPRALIVSAYFESHIHCAAPARPPKWSATRTGMLKKSESSASIEPSKKKVCFNSPEPSKKTVNFSRLIGYQSMPKIIRNPETQNIEQRDFTVVAITEFPKPTTKNDQRNHCAKLTKEMRICIFLEKNGLITHDTSLPTDQSGTELDWDKLTETALTLKKEEQELSRENQRFNSALSESELALVGRPENNQQFISWDPEKMSLKEWVSDQT